MQFPEGDGPLDPEWFRPLFDLFPRVPAVGSLKYFDPDDFMLMGRLVRSPRPDITLYKHRYTRRYLNLDASGQAYRYFPPKEGSAGSGQYRPHKELDAALLCLGLWELPHMKPKLARILAEAPPFDQVADVDLDVDLGHPGHAGGVRRPAAEALERRPVLRRDHLHLVRPGEASRRW